MMIDRYLLPFSSELTKDKKWIIHDFSLKNDHFFRPKPTIFIQKFAIFVENCPFSNSKWHFYFRKRHPSNDKMLYMSPVDVSRVPLPVHPVHPSEVKLMMSHQGGAMTHQASPPPPYGMNYTTLVPCTQGYPTSVGYHPSQMNLTNNDSEYQSDHSTNHSYITRDSFPIHNGDVCEVWVISNDVIIYDSKWA